jgi:hypothetical protein
MAYVQMDGSYRPRSKKERDRIRARRLAERQGKKTRESIPPVNKFPSYSVPDRNVGLNICSGATIDPKPKSAEQKRYEGEMAERERIAQEEVQRKKKCIAPAYNKGAYQYIGSEEQAKWVGK